MPEEGTVETFQKETKRQRDIDALPSLGSIDQAPTSTITIPPSGRRGRFSDLSFRVVDRACIKAHTYQEKKEENQGRTGLTLETKGVSVLWGISSPFFSGHPFSQPLSSRSAFFSHCGPFLSVSLSNVSLYAEVLYCTKYVQYIIEGR
jgi:hypothetical protein